MFQQEGVQAMAALHRRSRIMEELVFNEKGKVKHASEF